MKYARFLSEDRTKYGVVEGKKIKEVSGNIFGEFEVTEKTYHLDKVKILTPCEPTKVILVGLNYIDHAKELKMDLPDEPIIFLKPSTAVIGPEDDIIYPKMCKQLDYEAELAVVMKRRAKSIEPGEVKDYILGYTGYNDVTARDLQRKDVQWTRAKSFDTFSPLGPYIVDEIDPNNLKIELFLNREMKQSSNTNNCVFSAEKLVSFISQVMTLLPGDVIATGTPVGVGPMKVGDTVEVRIEKIGTLRNYVKEKI
jgi:2-keto-4-pentenoate hydratase/2-oxohepta-3-ene-1,7-dioic acid hydratase in catechol pathway